MARILVIEDEACWVGTVRKLLASQGYEVEQVSDGCHGYTYVLSGAYDLMVLGVRLKGMNGYELVERLRRSGSRIPALMLTEQGSSDDRCRGLEAGVDYYLTEPFDDEVLLACVRALLRRTGVERPCSLRFGNTVLELSGSRLWQGDSCINLSEKEHCLMELLMKNPQMNLTKEEILIKIWGYDAEVSENSVEAYMSLLRRKLHRIHSNLAIAVRRRQGYHLEVQAQIPIYEGGEL